MGSRHGQCLQQQQRGNDGFCGHDDLHLKTGLRLMRRAGCRNAGFPLRQSGNTMLSMKSLSVKLPDPLFEQLMAKAQLRATTHSDLVRAALTAYLHADDSEPIASCAHVGKRWTGIMSGPGDLSTNPAHMEGFGR